MTAKLTAIAQADTPASVEVPSSWAGLIVWASARFGVGIIFAVVFGYETREVYNDGKARQEQLMQYVTERNKIDSQRAVSDAELARSLAQLSTVIERMCEDAKQAHNGTASIKRQQ